MWSSQMEANPYWVQSSVTGISNNSNEAVTQQQIMSSSKMKESDVSVISQPTMVNFANIFAGATAAVASTGSANTDVLVSAD